MNKNNSSAGTKDEQRTTAESGTSASLVQNGMLSAAVQEGDILIAEFLGWDLQEFGKPPFAVYKLKGEGSAPEGHFPYNLFFHSSWEWLMPACKKFIDLYFDVLEIKAHEEHILRCESLNNAVTKYEIRPAFKQLIENIKWYNAQNNKSV